MKWLHSKCWVNRKGLFKVHDMVHDFLNKAFRVARFSVVHTCTKTVYEAQEISCTRISHSFSPESRKNLEKSHPWPLKRLSTTRKIFKRDHWFLPELKQLVTQTNHIKSLVFLMADIALRYTVQTRFTNLHKIHFM